METKTAAQEILAAHGYTGTAAEIRKQLKDNLGFEFGNARLTESWIEAAERVQLHGIDPWKNKATGETEDSPEAIQKAANDELYDYLETQVSEVAPEPKVIHVTKENIDSFSGNGQSAEILAIDEFPVATENLVNPWNLLGFIDTKRLLKGMQPKRQKPQGFGIPVHSNQGATVKGIKSNRWYNIAMKVISGLKLKEYRTTSDNFGDLQTA